MHSPPTLTAISQCHAVQGLPVYAVSRYTLRNGIW